MDQNGQIKGPKEQDYKRCIQRGVRQFQREADLDLFLQFFQQYWFQQLLHIPPWAEDALTFYQENQAVITRLLKDLGAQEVPANESRVGWIRLPKSQQWVRVVQGQCVPLQIYFTCNLWKKGAPSEQAELTLLRRQIPAGMLFYPGEFDFGEADAEARAAYCQALVRDHADVLIFSELEAEYGRFFGFGVYGDLQAAQRKGIPIFLLQDEQFWLNPQIELHDSENLVCHAKVCATPHPPLQYLEDWFYFGEG